MNMKYEMQNNSGLKVEQRAIAPKILWLCWLIPDSENSRGWQWMIQVNESWGRGDEGERERWLWPISPESNYKLQNCERKEGRKMLAKTQELSGVLLTLIIIIINILTLCTKCQFTKFFVHLVNLQNLWGRYYYDYRFKDKETGA